MKNSTLSAERARELFNYDPETGLLTWKVYKGPRAQAGQVAGTLRSDGYLQVRADSVLYLAHRLVWLIVTGAWPEQLIDHRFGSRADNSWLNLRDSTRAVNQENQRHARADSTTGLLGVSPRRGRFRSRIKVKGSEVYLGTYTTPEEAHQAYLTSKRQLHAGCTI